LAAPPESSVHEVALAEAVWRQVTGEMGRHQGGCLLAVDLVVGEWSGADPESLEFALSLVAADSKWPEACLRIRRQPLALRCRACGREFEPAEKVLACPGCGSADTEIFLGRDVYLESLEIE